jgi:hypothetical protein
MSGTQQGKRALVAGLFFLGLALATIAWSYLHQRTTGRTGASSSEQQASVAQTIEAQARTAAEDARTPASVSDTPVSSPTSRTYRSSDGVSVSPVAFSESGASRLAVAADANPDVASVVEAAKTGRDQHRRTVYIAPAPFDRAAFDADPEKYCRTIEPGRVWQAAKPGPDVPALEVVGDSTLSMHARGTVELSVQAVAGFPVAFSSMDLGAFENRLTSITVRTDAKGVARTKFTATEGTTGTVNVLAASPGSSGQVHFRIEVRE